MIVGIGLDMTDIRRIEKALERFGDRFRNRCFTEVEQARSEARYHPAWSYAKRYAAKEAGAKALGTGLAQGVSWREIGVVNLPSGQPTLVMTGRARERLMALMPAGKKPNVQVTLTDDYPYAQAMVIIEAV